ncbi:MAG: hypothetical protein EOO52_08745 [Gammaproteobacteria bacterium]|nr:MAG: hypothetical protein EOO52_08745 [Gammaproteobacteria bacterium]
MEHRCTERNPSELKILICRHNHPVAIGRIKNGSQCGVFVETDFVDIDCEHQVRLEVLLNKNPFTKLQRIEMQAIVIHKEEKGFGAEVDFAKDSDATAFMDILKYPQSSMPDNRLLAKAANH